MLVLPYAISCSVPSFSLQRVGALLLLLINALCREDRRPEGRFLREVLCAPPFHPFQKKKLIDTGIDRKEGRERRKKRERDKEKEFEMKFKK